MKIRLVKSNSPAAHAGVQPGNDVISVNGFVVNDEIDVLFYGTDEYNEYSIISGGKSISFKIHAGEDHGIEFESMNLMNCGNNCVFCFIDQNPRGMRKTLYFKDEDYRLSFLHGAYVTLTTLKDKHLRRIEEQHLSPLYISVHATDTAVRKKMLGISRDDGLMEKIDRLVDSGIMLHTQIVVCPGFNDGAVLTQSIHDLYDRYPGIRSVAVVPVGLTKHRNCLPSLEPVDRDTAVKTIELVDKIHKEFVDDNGTGFVYCADEWYIKAGRDVPETAYYDDFPQIENGVGMVRDFLESVENLENRLDGELTDSKKYVFVTGTSMSPYIEALSYRLAELFDIKSRVATVGNSFYGDSVTVSGLLTGGDIIDALDGTDVEEIIVLPPNCLNEGGFFLDDISPDDIGSATGSKVIEGSYDPAEIFLESEQQS